MAQRRYRLINPLITITESQISDLSVGRIQTDINTATPPTNEGVTGFFEIRDAEDVDPLAKFGFDNDADLFIRSFMEGSAVRIQGTASGGALREYFEGGASLSLKSPLNIALITNGVETIRAERSSTLGATETSLWLYDEDNDTLTQVTVGADDSGGSGFKVLRIAN